MVFATHRALSVAVLAGHGEIEAEPIGIDHLDVTSLRAAQSVDTTVEGLVSGHLHHDACVFAVNGDCNRHNKTLIDC